jgi:hypothetical protein
MSRDNISHIGHGNHDRRLNETEKSIIRIDGTLKNIDSILERMEKSIDRIDRTIENMNVKIDTGFQFLNEKIDRNFKWSVGLFITQMSTLVMFALTHVFKG